MTEKDFDEFIRKAASSNLSPDECFNWENMNIPIPKRKRRAPFFLFFFLGLGALCLLGGMYFFLNSTKVQTAERISISNEKYDLHVLDSSKIVNDVDLASKKEMTKDITNQDSKFDSRSINTSIKENTLPTKPQVVAYMDSNLDVVTEEALTKGVRVGTKKNVTPDINTSVQEILSLEEVEYRMFDRFYFESPVLAMNYLKPERRLNYWFVKGGVLTHKNLIEGNEFTDTNFGRNSSGLFIAISKHHSLRRNWFLETGFTYSRLNHYYRGEQDLGYINDISAAERISSRRIIKHNNLIEIAEVQLGLGKVISLAENFQFLSSISVLPGVVTRRAGRVFLPNESTPISIEEATNGFPFSLSSELMLGLQYQVRENVGIGLIAGNKYYFTSIPILTEKQRPNIMSIGLSIRMSVGD
jgi:hypothetical protein